MSEVIVHRNGGVVLLGGGAVCPADLTHALQLAPCLVAADGGGNKAIEYNYQPVAVIGDMDSLSSNARDQIPAERIHRVAEQDSTDFGKCLRFVHADFFLAIGFTGRRLDHTLATLSYLAQNQGVPILLIGEEDLIFRAPPRFSMALPVGTRLSLFPFGAVQGRSQGLRWPIDGIALAPNGRVGTSNEVSGPVVLDLDGPCLILLPKSCFDQALAVVRGA
ncbi:thiamine diphosphokinase [Thioclava sp. SK-1]|uniref:thiamine diphosphokinase n=1 Tax=Thioclava sp. SK-1 TaxID=1889770 RepID=UPI0008259486|nr:thiamine diphosphokinase [Thioclava sp. SK-1]OCX61220.1 thiamine diphosphokinase [Thioclava sp. SK-1]